MSPFGRNPEAALIAATRVECPHCPCPYFVSEDGHPDECCYCDAPRDHHSPRALEGIAP